MNFYQIIPKDYVLKLQSEENYKKAGAFMNYWFLFFSSFKTIEEVEDEDIEKFKKKYSIRTLGKVFNLKGHQSIVNYRDEFIEVIMNFIAYWKLKNIQNQTQVKSAQKEVEHFENTSRTDVEHFENIKENTQDSNKHTEKSDLKENKKNEVEHKKEQQENTSRTDVEHFENEYINKINNKKNKKEKEIQKLQQLLKEFFEEKELNYLKVNQKYDWVIHKLLQNYSYEDIEKVIEFAKEDSFYKRILLNPNSFLNNFESMKIALEDEINNQITCGL